jgi:AcrR family transcriptional regulator
MEEMKSRRDENAEATRAAIVSIARKHFTRDGYADTEISKIASEARVTTGAVYHHFSGKKDLFLAVAELLEVEILAAAGSVDERDPWARMKMGFERLIDFCARSDVQRITFVEAPQVIGPEAWRKIELRYAYGAVREALAALVATGIVKAYPVDLIARILLALLHETSAEVARSRRKPEVRKQISELVNDMFRVLTR